MIIQHLVLFWRICFLTPSHFYLGRKMNIFKNATRKYLSLVLLTTLLSMVSFFTPEETASQMQFQAPPQAPVQAMPRPGPPPRQTVQPAPQQMPSEYAFRPNLSNPEFGECLQLERNWKTLWNSYYQAYYHAQRMSPSDPQYQQMAAYVNNLRYQLDAAWSNFSGKCIYFPRR